MIETTQQGQQPWAPQKAEAPPSSLSPPGSRPAYAGARPLWGLKEFLLCIPRECIPPTILLTTAPKHSYHRKRNKLPGGGVGWTSSQFFRPVTSSEGSGFRLVCSSLVVSPRSLQVPIQQETMVHFRTQNKHHYYYNHSLNQSTEWKYCIIISHHVPCALVNLVVHPPHFPNTNRLAHIAQIHFCLA